MLEPSISKSVSMCSSEHTNLQFRKLLKLQPGLICTSDVGCVKPKVPLLDYERISEGWMAEKIPRQKWSISYLWEHFLVPEHRIPIWLDFVLGFSVEFMNAKHNSLDTRTQTSFQNVLDHQSCDTCTRTEPILQIQGTLEFESCDTCTRMEPILQTWKPWISQNHWN